MELVTWRGAGIQGLLARNQRGYKIPTGCLGLRVHPSMLISMSWLNQLSRPFIIGSQGTMLTQGSERLNDFPRNTQLGHKQTWCQTEGLFHCNLARWLSSHFQRRDCSVGLGFWSFLLPLLLPHMVQHARQKTTCGNWFSPSAVWVLGLNSCLQTWWQATLPTEPGLVVFQCLLLF